MGQNSDNLGVIDLTDLDSDPKEIEDGEVSDDELKNSLTGLTTLVFEIKFPQNKDFKELGHRVMSTLENELNSDGLKNYEFKIVNADNDKNTTTISVSTCQQQSHPATSNEEVVAEDEEEMEPPGSPDSIPDLSALFTIDTNPVESLDTVRVPSYKRVIKNALDDVNEQEKKKIDDMDYCPRPRQTSACFNCGSMEHSLRDCHKPRNGSRISRAKKKFASKQDRYHVDVEQRFAHLQPGTISENFRQAMGLRRKELPFFFYRMRLLGYPPGWLENAKVEKSGISLIDKSDGGDIFRLEMDADNNETACSYKYDINKLIDYPGFNFTPDNFYDDFKHHDVPPMEWNHSKEAFIKMLGEGNILKGYKRKKMNDNISGSAPVDCSTSINASIEVADMDIEDEIDDSVPQPPSQLPPALPNPPPPPTESRRPPSPKDDKEMVDVDDDELGPSPAKKRRTRSQSLTLDDLEMHRQKLLEDLEGNTSLVQSTTNNSFEMPPPDDDDVLMNTRVSILDDDISTSTQNECTINESIIRESTHNDDDDTDTPSTPSTPHLSWHSQADIIKDTHLGTPVLKFSPFDKLPAGDNFKVGVSDVINFENLPDSTGKYEQMKIVISRVRNVITKLQSEDD